MRAAKIRTLFFSAVMLGAGALGGSLAAAQGKAEAPLRQSTAAQIDFDGFSALTGEVNSYRSDRLVDLAEFQRMAREGDTLILDARSAEAFAAGHIDGAINLSFPDFTAESLARAIGDPGRRILIYCNNNFENDRPPVVMKRIELALNIQTFINLYGYGYRNVYELGDVVNFDDPAVRWVRGS